MNEIPTKVTQRLEARTPNTAECPDTPHRHEWVKRPPELTLGTKRGVVYDASAAGVVEISEEALSQLLRMAGFVPKARRERSADYLVSTPRGMPRGVFTEPLPEHPDDEPGSRP